MVLFSYSRLFPRWPLLLLVFLFFCLAFSPEIRAETLSIQEAIHIALENKQSIEAAVNRAEASREQYKTARAARFLRIDLASNLERRKYLDETRGSLPRYGSDAGLRVNQPLYTGGQISNQIYAAERTADAAEMTLKSIRRDLSLAVILACRNLQQAYAFGDIAKEAEDLLDGLFKNVKASYKAGAISLLALGRVEAQLMTVNVEARTAERARREAMDSLVSLLGVSDSWNEDIRIEDDPEMLPDFEGMPLEKMVETALNNRPDILELNSRVLSQQHRTAIEKSGYLPSLNLAGEYIFTGNHDVSPSGALGDLEKDYWSVSLRASINLFEAGATKHSVLASMKILEALNNDLANLRSDTASQVERYFHYFRNQKTVMETARKNMLLEKENLRMVMEEFRLGASTVDKLADYHTRRLESQKRYTEALLELQKAGARLKWSYGVELP